MIFNGAKPQENIICININQSVFKVRKREANIHIMRSYCIYRFDSFISTFQSIICVYKENNSHTLKDIKDDMKLLKLMFHVSYKYP